MENWEKLRIFHIYRNLRLKLNFNRFISTHFSERQLIIFSHLCYERRSINSQVKLNFLYAFLAFCILVCRFVTPSTYGFSKKQLKLISYSTEVFNVCGMLIADYIYATINGLVHTKKESLNKHTCIQLY